MKREETLKRADAHGRMRLPRFSGGVISVLLLVIVGIVSIRWQKKLETTQEAGNAGVSTSHFGLGPSGAAGRSKMQSTLGQRSRQASHEAHQAKPVASPPPKPSDVGVLGNLRSSEPGRRIEAAGQIIAKPSSELVEALLEETSRCEDVALRQKLLDYVRRVNGSQYAHLLVSVLLSPKNGDLRNAARDALIRSSAPTAVRELIQGASQANSEPLVRDIGRTIARIQGVEAVGELLGGIDSERPAVQAGCVAALADIGTAEVASALYSKYEASDETRRDMILEGFSRFRNPEAAQALERIAQVATDPKLRTLIAGSLERIASSLKNTGNPK